MNRITDLTDHLSVLTGSNDKQPGRSEAGSGSHGKLSVAEVIRPLEALIRRYPAASLGVALSMGVLVGWLVKRN